VLIAVWVFKGVALSNFQNAEASAPIIAPVQVAATTTKQGTSNSTNIPSDAYTRAVAASVTTSRRKLKPPSNLHPSLLQIHNDITNLNGCTAGFGTRTSSPICNWGDTSSHRTVVVFGDSHAQMWIPAFTYFANSHHWRLVPIIKEGCVAVNWSPAVAKKADCTAWLRWATAEIHSTASATSPLSRIVRPASSPSPTPG
jgi:hypothetical protein